MCIYNNETYIEKKLILPFVRTDTIYSDFLHQYFSMAEKEQEIKQIKKGI